MLSIKKYLWVAHLFVIAICSYFAAQTVTTYVSMMLEEGGGQIGLVRQPLAQAALSRLEDEEAYEVVVERNIFNSAETPEEPLLPPELAKQEVDLSGPAQKTSLGIKVLGTLVVGEGTDRRSSATVSGGKARKADVYFVKGKESFADDVELVKVMKDRIEFVNKGRLEYAMLEGLVEDITIFARAEDVHYKDDGKKKSARRPAIRREREEEEEAEEESGGDVVTIDQQEVDDALSNLDKLYTEIRIVPNFKDGKAAGMKVLAVKPGSLFSKLGLKRGDVLERINGLELDIKRGMELFGQLKNQKSLKVELVRRGQSKTLEYEIR